MKKDKRVQGSTSPLETLRIERTIYSQAEFAVRCGIPLRTYQRMISGEVEGRLTARQVKAVCKELGIERVDELPDSFGPEHEN